MVDEDRIFTRAAWRLIPFMGLLYVVSFLDRVNVGFAALTMNADLGLDATTYGIGAGVFFIGYFVFEVPSNAILERVGARLWMCRIGLTWGLVSMSTAFVHGAHAFYLVRFLLGAAEAGFFPGMVLYLTYWFPQDMRARFLSLFMIAIPLASVIGAPLSGYILGLEGADGLHGWQWLFLIEGLPSCVLAFATLVFLPDKPFKARWLAPSEAEAIEIRLRREAPASGRLLSGLQDSRVWLLALADFGIVTGLYGIGLWLPQMIKAMGYSNLATGFIVAVPYLASVIGMIAWGISSDLSRERVWHVVVAALIAAAALMFAALRHGSFEQVAALSVAAVGIYASLSTFWALPPSCVGGSAAAGGIAFINSISNLGGFVGPYLMGWLKSATGGYSTGMMVLSVLLTASAFLVLLIGRYLGFEGRPAFDGSPT